MKNASQCGFGKWSLLSAAMLAVCGVQPALADELPVRYVQSDTQVADEDAAPAEKVAYVGIGTDRTPANLAGHLKLDKGVGLVITQVMEGSPAADAGLGEGDVLVKFDDQLLITPEQFATLVRLREIGEEIPLTLVQQGEQKQVNLTLGETAFRAMATPLRVFTEPDVQGRLLRVQPGGAFQLHGRFPGEEGFLQRDDEQALARRLAALQLDGEQLEQARRAMGEAQREVARVRLMLNEEELRPMRDDMRVLLNRIEGMPGAMPEGDAAMNVRVNIVQRDNGEEARYTIEGDQRSFRYVVDDEVIFDGPVTTDAQREKMPEQARAKLEAFEKQTNIQTIEPAPGDDEADEEVDDLEVDANGKLAG